MDGGDHLCAFPRPEAVQCAVSQKILTRTLRNLERNGLVERQVYPIIPPKVEYALTPLGKTLIALLLTMNTWAESICRSWSRLGHAMIRLPLRDRCYELLSLLVACPRSAARQ